MLATFVGMPILTRTYDPEVFSAWVMLLSASILFTTIATLRLDLAILLPKKNEDAATLWTLSCLVSVFVAAIAFLVIHFLSSFLLGGFDKILQPYLWLLPFWIVSAGIFQACMSWYTRTEKFGLYSIGQFALPVSTIGAQIFLSFPTNNSLLGLVAGAIGAQGVVAMVSFLNVALGEPAITRSSMSATAMRGALKEYRVYPTYMTAYSALATIRDRFVYFLIGNYSTKVAAGYYGLSQRFVNIPNRLASSSLRPVFFQKSTQVGFKNMLREINFILLMVVATVVPGWVVFMLHAHDLFAFAFGESWRGAGTYGILLSIPAIPLLIGNWMDRGFDALGKQKTAFWIEIIFSIVAMVGLCIGVFAIGSIFAGIVIQISVLSLYYWVWLWILLKLGDYPAALFGKVFGLYAAQSILCLILGSFLSNRLDWKLSVISCLLLFYTPLTVACLQKRALIMEMIRRP